MTPHAMGGVAVQAALQSATPPFVETLGIWLVDTLLIAGWLLVCGVIFLVPLFAVYGAMFALSRLAGRVRRRRRPGGG